MDVVGVLALTFAACVAWWAVEDRRRTGAAERRAEAWDAERARWFRDATRIVEDEIQRQDDRLRASMSSLAYSLDAASKAAGPEPRRVLLAEHIERRHSSPVAGCRECFYEVWAADRKARGVGV